MISVTHLVTSSGGGAGRAAVRAHLAARGQGVHSTLLCLNDVSKPPGAVALRSVPPDQETDLAYQRFRGRFFDHNRTSISSTAYHPGLAGHSVAHLPQIQRADVIHLHWINDFLTPETIAELVDLGKPMVWTLHDFWPLTGGCHFPAGCEGYKVGCGFCRQLLHAPDFPALILAEKKRHYGGAPIKMTAPSSYMMKEIRESILFRGCEPEVLPNAVDVETFTPVSDTERAALRGELGLAEDDLVLLITAQNIREKRKGFITFYNAVRAVQRRAAQRGGTPARELAVISVGHHDISFSDIGVRSIKLPHVNDDALLADVMRLSDFIVHPALEETFGLGIMEAMACGTPPVIFENGGSLDFVRDGENGFVLRPNQDVGALADWIESAMEGGARSNVMRQAARATAKNYSFEKIGVLLAKFYSKLTGRPLPEPRAGKALREAAMSLVSRKGGRTEDAHVSALATTRASDYAIRKSYRASDFLHAQALPKEFAGSLGAQVKVMGVENSAAHLSYTTSRVTFTVADDVCGVGWHGLETVEGKPVRWMDRRGLITLGGHFAGEMTLTISGVQAVTPEILQSMAVKVDGAPAPGIIRKTGPKSWEFEAQIEPRDQYVPTLALEIAVSATHRPSNDTRDLSLLVSGIELAS